MELGLTQRQGQTLSPQMIQSVEVLQMTSQELLGYLETTVQENPVLELEEYHDAPDEGEDLCRKLEWLESNDAQNRDYHCQDSLPDADPMRNRGRVDCSGESLYGHLRAQLELMTLEEGAADCARFLTACLDSRGWLAEDLTALAQELCVPEQLLERALAVVQSLEPAGVGARDLSECLCLQLLRRAPVDRLALDIARKYLEAVSKSRYGLISHALGVSQEEVRRACDVIRSLDPHPGAAFAAHEEPVYITPDITIVSNDGQFELLPNDRFFPSLSISPYYARLLQESEDEQVRDYLTAKVQQAKWMIRAIEQRRNTLMACARCILELQEDFFRLGQGHLKPMSLMDVAERIGAHESTVCRAVNGKYLQCAKGTFPLSYFFSRRLSGAQGDADVSVDAAKALLKRLISEEDKRRPLSDQKLCERMEREGCALARRTVAKYRDELGIPGASGRRRS